MNKFSFFTKCILLILSLSVFCCNAQVKDQELQNKILWINHITEIVTKILTYNNKLVLTQEYEKLLDKTNFDNLPDGEIKNLVNELIDTLKTLSDNWEEKDRAKKLYEKACSDALRDAVFSSIECGVSIAPVIMGNAMETCAEVGSRGGSIITGYFAAKSAAEALLGDKTWEIDSANRAKIHELRLKIWNSVLEEMKSSNISDRSRISIGDNEFLILTLKNNNISEQFHILSTKNMKRRFANFPAFWYYLGRSALVTKNFEVAENSFKIFRDNYRSIFRDDDLLHNFMIAEISLLMRDINANRKQIKTNLEKLCETVPVEEWEKHFFAANAYLALGEYDTTERLLNTNLATLSAITREYSHHEYVDLLGTPNDPLLESSGDTTMAMHRILIAKSQLKKKSFDFNKFMTEYNQKQTITIYEKMSYFGAVTDDKIAGEINKYLTSTECEAVFYPISDTEIYISLPEEWFFASPRPKLSIQFDNVDLTLQNAKIEGKRNGHINLLFTTDWTQKHLTGCKEMYLTIHHKYCPVKLIFSIPEINPAATPPEKAGNRFSKLWNRTKSTIKNSAKIQKYKFHLKKFIFNQKEFDVK